jgi:hypothetical protein
VACDALVSFRQVRGGDHGLDLFERHVQGAESADDLGGRDLVGVVATVSGRRIDVGRFQ